MYKRRGFLVLLVAVVVTLVPAGAQQTSTGLIAERFGVSTDLVERVRTQRGMSEAALLALPAEQFKWIVLRAEFADLARERATFRRLQDMDERGLIPEAAKARALRELGLLRSQAPQEREVAGVPSGRRRGGRLIPETAGLNPSHAGWTYLGPNNIGGRTRAILIHPGDPNRIWTGTSGGGIWHSSDGGKSFAPVDDLMSNLAVTTLAMEPKNTKTLYAGTGEGFNNADALRGAGIFRSVDEGKTWSVISATAVPGFHYVNRIAIAGGAVLAATRSGTYRSADAARTTWTLVLPQDTADIDVSAANPMHAVASTMRNGRAYYTTDGGKTWSLATQAQPWSGRVELTYAAADPSIVYASVETGSGQIWRSSDGGKTYARMRSESAPQRPAQYLGTQGWYDNVIWAGDPTNAALVVVGGVDVWKSTDGGHTLVDVSTWWSRKSAHADHHAIVSHPQYDGKTNRIVFFGNDGGLYKTLDLATVGSDAQPPRESGWISLNNGYGATQFYGGAAHTTTGTVIGGSQDNGTLALTGGAAPGTWGAMFGGDGGWCATDPSDPNVFYGEYVNLNIHRSDDAAKSAGFISGMYWNGSAWVWKPFPYSIPDAQSRAANFIAPFILDPNEPTRLLAGGLELWRTNDAKAPVTNASGPKWQSIKPGTGVPISAIAIARGHAEQVWVGHNDGSVYRTLNGSDTAPAWIRLDESATPLPDRYVTRITLDPANSQVVYVTFGGYTKGNVWKTVDGGAKWRNIASTLPEAPVRTLVVHPNRSAYVYVGSEVGAFASEDGGATWSPTNEGPTNASVDELFWMGDTLIAATHGRGMFAIRLPPKP